MRPIPIVFHIGPLQVHTYGIGLAVTFLFAYWYFARRLRDHGYPDRWLGDAFLWIIGMALVGARTFHVLANLSFYSGHPGEIPLVWHGGLSSFGGLAFGIPTGLYLARLVLGHAPPVVLDALRETMERGTSFGIPTGLYLARRRCPQLPLGVAGDLIAPVLVAGWAVGRLLGPQLMIAGGGHPTSAWYGMYYAGQVGKRVPVPLLQAAECALIFVVLLWVERVLHRRGDRPVGMLAATAVTLWDASRISDEHFFLATPGHTGAIAVQVGAAVLTGLGAVAMLVLWLRDRRRPPAAPVETADLAEVGARHGGMATPQATAPAPSGTEALPSGAPPGPPPAQAPPCLGAPGRPMPAGSSSSRPVGGRADHDAGSQPREGALGRPGPRGAEAAAHHHDAAQAGGQHQLAARVAGHRGAAGPVRAQAPSQLPGGAAHAHRQLDPTRRLRPHRARRALHPRHSHPLAGRPQGVVGEVAQQPDRGPRSRRPLQPPGHRVLQAHLEPVPGQHRAGQAGRGACGLAPGEALPGADLAAPGGQQRRHGSGCQRAHTDDDVWATTEVAGPRRPAVTGPARTAGQGTASAGGPG